MGIFKLHSVLREHLQRPGAHLDLSFPGVKNFRDKEHFFVVVVYMHFYSNKDNCTTQTRLKLADLFPEM